MYVMYFVLSALCAHGVCALVCVSNPPSSFFVCASFRVRVCLSEIVSENSERVSEIVSEIVSE